MHHAGIFRGLVISHPPTLEQVNQKNRRAGLLLIVILVAACLLITFVYLQGLLQAWQTGLWGDAYWMDSFTSNILIPFFSTSMGLFSLSVYFAQTANERVAGAEALPVREAAAAGDERFAPLAEQQPTTLSLVNAADDFDQGEHFRVRAAGKKGKSIQIVVDEQGIKWSNPQWWRPGWHRLRWSDARAFYTFFYLYASEKNISERQQVYVLDAPAHTLVWMASFPWITNTTQQKAALERLHGLIATYTRLPLRDLTKAADDLEMVISSSFVGLTVEGLTKATQRFAFLPHPPERINPKQRWRTAYSGLLPLLLIGICAATAFGVQTYEVSSYNALLAQVRTHKPLYQHALAVVPADYYYIKAGNNIPFDAPAFQTPETYGDVAVEVTVQALHEDSSAGDIATSFALLLRGYSTEDGIVFQISMDGTWSIGRPIDEPKNYTQYAETYLHRSNAIHTAPGASNRMAVVMRGQQYLCYVNDQFVGSYQDSDSPNGPIGLDVGISNDSTAFHNFTIYPL